ncbi:hypothetical protein B0H19DRAFT_1126284 [Mycena capillaripes]|nr:hypothetical protein B0H19DRAFT_1126284 [Mycena capillaripes]
MPQSESPIVAASTPCIGSRDESGFVPISDAIEQIRRLELLDLETIVKDTTVHHTISLASSGIFNFLDSVLQERENSPQRLTIFGKLFDVTFLTVLFEQRKIFHRIAAQSFATEPGSSVAVICWVDSILHKLGDVTIAVASGISSDLTTPLLPGSTQFRAEDGLRAASQLPSNWSSVAGLIASDQASPAAKRLALRLTFAAFILRPCLYPESEHSIPCGTLEVLDRCLDQTRGTTFSASRVGDQLAIQERLNFAMIVSLYAAADREQRNGSQIRPRSLGCLLDILQDVLHPNEPVSSLQFASPPEDLDPAQMVLLRWGDTVSWCWETWDDHRVANAESIVFLTSMWLAHSNVHCPSHDVNVHSAASSTASSIAILRVLHQVVLSLSTVSPAAGPPSVSMAVTSQACSYAVNSMKHLLCGQKEDERWIVSGLCKYLFSLFVLLAAENDEGLSVDDCILEALSLVDAETLHICLVHVQQDHTVRFTTRLHERLIRVQTFTSTLAQTQIPKIDLVRSTLNFAAIIWFSQTRGCLLRESVSPVLSDVAEFLIQQGSPGLACKILGDAILTASSAARKDPSITDENRESLWQFAISSLPSELSIASSLADYIITSECLCNSLYCAEAWRYLGDILLLILKHHYIGEQEPLALLTCPTICGAMIRLLRADTASSEPSTSS